MQFRKSVEQFVGRGDGEELRDVQRLTPDETSGISDPAHDRVFGERLDGGGPRHADTNGKIDPLLAQFRGPLGHGCRFKDELGGDIGVKLAVAGSSLLFLQGAQQRRRAMFPDNVGIALRMTGEADAIHSVFLENAGFDELNGGVEFAQRFRRAATEHQNLPDLRFAGKWGDAAEKIVLILNETRRQMRNGLKPMRLDRYGCLKLARGIGRVDQGYEHLRAGRKPRGQKRQFFNLSRRDLQGKVGEKGLDLVGHRPSTWLAWVDGQQCPAGGNKGRENPTEEIRIRRRGLPKCRFWCLKWR